MSLAKQELEILEQYRFGDFLLNVSTRELRYQDQVLHLSGKPYDVFVYLVRHRERVVSGEEIFESIWGHDADGIRVYDPQYIQQAISTIRKVLGDNPRAPKYVSTDRGHGFRFIAALSVGDSQSPIVGIAARVAVRKRMRLSPVWLSIAALALLAVMLIFTVPKTNRDLPRVVNAIPLTHTGFAKYAPILTTGKDLYFTEFANGHYRIRKVDESTAAVSVFATTVPEPYLCGISPDGKAFLVRSVVSSFEDYGPLFIQPLDGGPAKPLPITAFDASWTPSGNGIIFARGEEVSLFDLMTQQHRVIARVDGYAWWPRWSPDGKRLRFTVSDGKTQDTALWEVMADGSNLRRLFSEDTPWGKAAAGNWTRDGRYFVFQVNPLAATSLWLLDETRKVSVANHNPTQLTFGSTFRGPQLSWDAKKIYARSFLYRGELNKFQLSTGGQSIFLPSVMADMVSFNRNGQSLVYCLTDQEKTLWMSGMDGNSPRRLIQQPTESAFPQWSPDGKRVVVATRNPGQPWKLSLVSPDSGKVEELNLVEGNAIHPSWSPDGQRIVFGSIPAYDENPYLYFVNVSDRRVSTVPGSQGLFTPAWSPDGRFIAAVKAESRNLVIYDINRNSWSTLGDGRFGYPVWSSDSKLIYCFRYEKQGIHVVRVHVNTGKSEQLLDFMDFPLSDRWLGLHPDGSILVAKNSVQEIFALELNLH